MKKLDKEKLPYKYQDMIEELTENTVKFLNNSTVYQIKNQTELLRVARQVYYEERVKQSFCLKCEKQLDKPVNEKIYLVEIIGTSNSYPSYDFLILKQFVFNKYDLDLLLKAYPKSRYKEI